MDATPSPAPATTHPAELDVAGILQRAWKLFVDKPVEHVLAGLVVVVLGAFSLGVVLGPLLVGYIRMTDRQRRGEAIAVGQVFQGFDVFWSSLALTLIVAISAGIGFLLFVLPGLAVLAIWTFAAWYLALQEHGAIASLGAAWRLFRANVGSVLIVFVIMTVINSAGSAILLATLFTFPFGIILGTVSFAELEAGPVAAGPA